jgi:hypothetical protein
VVTAQRSRVDRTGRAGDPTPRLAGAVAHQKVSHDLIGDSLARVLGENAEDVKLRVVNDLVGGLDNDAVLVRTDVGLTPALVTLAVGRVLGPGRQ